jgi:inhibitor of KinA
MVECRLVPAGDSTLIVEFADKIDPVINAAAIALAASVRAADIAGVRDVAAAYRSVAIHFDPLRVDYGQLVARVRRETSHLEPAMSDPGETIQVPVCYAPEYGPDLADVAAFAGITEAEAVILHSARTYRVFMLGFTPGFTYMGVVDERIAAPRLAVPRVTVPAGSVGIAGAQTGIYPSATPGGWRIVGRTPVRPFDLARPSPCLFKPGDAVTFQPIEPSDFARMQNAV